ncbi:hypothetical protein F5Y04DRAFT_285217 [Hypomontagnella monticulosa]|nr:hypothetical protein F5Y04DRAFT_285217 [Hypomontagnella monticulosa]
MESSTPSESERVPALMTTGLIVVSVIFPAWSLIFVLLRFRARYVIRAPFLADDWWILVSWFITVFLSIDVWVVASITGVDYYKIDVVEGLTDSVIALCTSGVVAQVALTTVKIGVLLYYKRLFPTRKFKIAVWIGIVITSCWGITLFFLLMFQGDTVQGTFRGTAHWVLDTTQLGLAQCWTSIILDLAILCYPLPILWNMHMKTNRKIAITLIFWLGLFCCVAAAVRLYLVKENIEKVSESAGQQIHSEYVEIMFVIIEPNCSIVAACLPCYGPIFFGGRGNVARMLQSARSLFSLRSTKSTSQMARGSRQEGQPSEPVPDSRFELDEHDRSRLKAGYATHSTRGYSEC